MAKADITLPSGAKVTVEGSLEEIHSLLVHYSSNLSQRPGAGEPRPRKTSPVKRNGLGPKGRVLELKQEGFFNTKQSLKAIQEKLAERGYIYPQNSLSATLIRLTKTRELGRLKEGGVWMYVNR